MRKLLIASNNAHKIEEFRQIFAELPFEVTFLENEGITLDPEETGTTFAENATLKAVEFATASGLLTLADDSGLEVDALDKAPGVYSARYGDLDKDDHEGRYRLVLDQLAQLNLPDSARTARFRCVIAICDPDASEAENKVHLVEGKVEGVIAHKPRGTNGFGYDPIFYLPQFDQTMAELSSEAKNQISHRGNAAQAAVPVLANLLNG